MADGYRVVAQRQTTDITPGGRFADVMEVTAETTKGTTFSVRLPVASFTADAAREALDERYAHIVEVENL